MSVITSITYNSDGSVGAYVEDGFNATIQKDTTGSVLSIRSIKDGQGTVVVPEYDSTGNVYGVSTTNYSSLGLVAAGSQLLKNGQVWRGAGVNFFDCVDHNDLASRFAELVSYGVPVIRTNFGFFDSGSTNTNGWRLYLTNKSAFYALLDGIVSNAESAGLGIIASMFWRYATLPDLMYYRYGRRDALDQWGDTNSNTRNYMRQITAEIVSRYKNSPAIWGWEFSNEYNTYTDLWPQDATALTGATGNPVATYAMAVNQSTVNGVSDYTTVAHCKAAFNDWLSVVQANDPYGRITSSGNALSAVNAWHRYAATYNGGGSVSIDTYDQWMGNSPVGTILSTPLPIYEEGEAGVISQHVYQQANVASWFFNDINYSAADMMTLLMSISKTARKPFFAGEWGSLVNQNGNGTTTTQEVAYFYDMANKIISNKVPLSLIWQYGYKPINSVTPWNIDPPGRAATYQGREYQLEYIATMNSQLTP